MKINKIDGDLHNFNVKMTDKELRVVKYFATLATAVNPDCNNCAVRLINLTKDFYDLKLDFDTTFLE